MKVWSPFCENIFHKTDKCVFLYFIQSQESVLLKIALTQLIAGLKSKQMATYRTPALDALTGDNRKRSSLTAFENFGTDAMEYRQLNFYSGQNANANKFELRAYSTSR